MKFFFAFFLTAALLAGCQPSETAIQTAMAQTQAAYTPTPPPTATVQPTVTPQPCTNKGWEDIGTYLKQFDQSAINLVEGTSISAYLIKLVDKRSKIEDVEIDACSENARQAILDYLAKKIIVYKLLFTKTDVNNEAATLFVESLNSLIEAEAELDKLGITWNYP